MEEKSKIKSIANIKQEEQEKISNLFETLGIFFAFSKEQFESKKKEGVEYVAADAGMLIPKDNVEKFVQGFEAIIAETKEQFKKHISLDELIADALNNHEACYTGELDDSLEEVQSTFPECTMEDVFRVYRIKMKEEDEEESEPRLLPGNLRKFVPRVQQMFLVDAKEHDDVIERLDSEIQQIPSDYQCPSELEIKQKGSRFDTLTVYAHFFTSSIDWYILSWDRENDILNNYMVGYGENYMNSLGDAFLTDLTTHPQVQMDFYWKRKSLAQALYEKYPDDFPKPSK